MTELIDHSDRVCVIGAGSSGLAAAHNLIECGFRPDIFDRDAGIGGIWNISNEHTRIYSSTRMISSRNFTQYPDFSMPRDWPDYPHHAQVRQYLHDYAEHFGLNEHIECNAGVARVEPDDDDISWRVTLEDGRVTRYHAVIIANGHNWHPNMPEIQGHFTGEIMHTADYRGPDVLKHKRVLVVGAGNSGCDIAVEAVQHAASASISMRRGYHFVPKYVFGRPVDKMLDKLAKLHVPLRIRRRIAEFIVGLVIGDPSRLGLPRPDHRLFETHPIINSLLPYYVAHGAITCRPDIRRFDDSKVIFTDDSEAEFDLIVFATGFRLVMPFIDKTHLNWKNGRPELYRNVFHPTCDTLFAAGMIQPDSGQFGLVHYQALAIARFLAALRDGNPAADRLRTLRQTSDNRSGFEYAESSRHLLEVEHWGYMKQMQKLCRMLEAK